MDRRVPLPFRLTWNGHIHRPHVHARQHRIHRDRLTPRHTPAPFQKLLPESNLAFRRRIPRPLQRHRHRQRPLQRKIHRRALRCNQRTHHQPRDTHQRQRKRHLHNYKSTQQPPLQAAPRSPNTPSQRRSQPWIRAMPRRSQPKNEQRKQRQPHRSQQHRNVHSNRSLIRNRVRRHNTQNRIQPNPRQRQRNRHCRHRQHQRFSQRRASQTHPRSPNRRPHRNLMLPAHRSRQQQTRNIHAGNQQEREHRSQNQIKRTRQPRLEHHIKGHDAHPQILRICMRSAVADVREDRSQISARLGLRHPRLQSSNQRKRSLPLHRLRCRHRGHVNRQIDIPTPPQKSRRHHPDNRSRPPIERKHPPQHMRVAAKVRLPIAITQQRNLRRTRMHIARHRRPPKYRVHPQHTESIRRNVVAPQQFRPRPACQRHRADRRRSHPIEDRRLIGNLHELRGGVLIRVALSPLRRTKLRRRQRLHILVRERIDQHTVRHAEDRRRSPDPQCQRQNRSNRKSRAPPQLPQREPKILPQHLHTPSTSSLE